MIMDITSSGTTVTATIDPLTDLDKLEQVKAAVLHTTHPVFCDDCKYNRASDCSLTGKLSRTAMRERITYADCFVINADNDCKNFKRTRISKFKRTIKWTFRWLR